MPFRRSSPEGKPHGILRNPSNPSLKGCLSTKDNALKIPLQLNSDRYCEKNIWSQNMAKRQTDEEKHALLDERLNLDEKEQSIVNKLRKKQFHNGNSTIQALNSAKMFRERAKNLQTLHYFISDETGKEKIKVESSISACQYLEAALPLLLNQNRVMQNTLDEIYNTTKQELSYFETVLKSLTVMTGMPPENSDNVVCHSKMFDDNSHVACNENQVQNMFDCHGEIHSSVST